MVCVLLWVVLGVMLELHAAPGWVPELGDEGFTPGSSVVLSVAQVVAAEEDGAEVRWGRKVWRLRGGEAWGVGEEWTVGGVWTGTEVEVQWAEFHAGRPAKRRLGIVGLFGVFVLCMASWSRSGWRIRIDG